MKRCFPWLTVGLVLLFCQPSQATTESARVYSRYFSAMADADPQDAAKFYANQWRIWLKYHRAIEANTALRRQVLKTPNANDETVTNIGKKLSINFAAQSGDVYLLQLGVYKSAKGGRCLS